MIKIKLYIIFYTFFLLPYNGVAKKETKVGAKLIVIYLHTRIYIYM